LIGLGLGLAVSCSLLLDSERAGEPRHTLGGDDLETDSDPDPDADPKADSDSDPDRALDLDFDLDLGRDNERSPRTTKPSRSGDVPESESRRRCFAKMGSMLRPKDALRAPGLVLVSLALLGGVAGVVGAGVSLADSDETEVVKSESLDSPMGIVSVPESAACGCS
jgi:hypothetical protein